MGYTATLRGERFRFADLRELMAKANEPKSGDALAGIAAASMRERYAAKIALADVRCADLVDRPVVDDGLTARLDADHDREAFRAIASRSIGELREDLLDPATDLTGLAGGVTAEVAAAVAKVMGNLDLVAAAARLRHVTRCRNTMGGAGVFGVRIQPNHPADDPAGVVLAVLDGLLFGCGDAVIGLNPVGDSVANVARLLHTLGEVITLLDLPTQSCVLAHHAVAAEDDEAGQQHCRRRTGGPTGEPHPAHRAQFAAPDELGERGRYRAQPERRQEEAGEVNDGVDGTQESLPAGARRT